MGAITKCSKHFLEKREPKVDEDNDLKNRTLILAAAEGNETAIQLLLDHGAQVDWKDKEGNAPLHWAVPEGHQNAVEVLLKNRADANVRDSNFTTPLYGAIFYESIARMLLSYGADVNVKNIFGETALIRCAHDGRAEVMHLLLENNVEVNAKDQHGVPALHHGPLRRARWSGAAVIGQRGRSQLV